MGCSCIKHNLIDEETNEFNPSEDNNKEQENIDSNININNYYIKITNDKTINNNNVNNNESEILNSGVIINNQSTSNINNNNNEDIQLKAKNIKSKEDQDNIITHNIINKESDYLSKSVYNKRIFELINKVRVNPAEYSKYVLDNIKNINIENKEVLNKNTEMKEINQITVFKKKVKVRLFKGEEGFFETAQYLQKLSPMEPLKFKEEIVIPIDNKDSMINIINKYNINAFFRGNIKNPEIAVLLMIVDDNESSEKRKRNTLLNKEYKYIGIDSKFFDKNFYAHFSFSK
jgi:hypothetical protein